MIPRFERWRKCWIGLLRFGTSTMGKLMLQHNYIDMHFISYPFVSLLCINITYKHRWAGPKSIHLKNSIPESVLNDREPLRISYVHYTLCTSMASLACCVTPNNILRFLLLCHTFFCSYHGKNHYNAVCHCGDHAPLGYLDSQDIRNHRHSDPSRTSRFKRSLSTFSISRNKLAHK